MTKNPISQSQADIAAMCDKIKALLLSKNESYGDSALNPSRIMSKASPVEQILIRIDDKLNRLMKGNEFGDEDTLFDVTGYFVLLLIAREREVNAKRLSAPVPASHIESLIALGRPRDSACRCVIWPCACACHGTLEDHPHNKIPHGACE